jgi:hypothetical protein
MKLLKTTIEEIDSNEFNEDIEMFLKWNEKNNETYEELFYDYHKHFRQTDVFSPFLDIIMYELLSNPIREIDELFELLHKAYKVKQFNYNFQWEL